MTDMQLKYMKVAAEVPKLQAESEQAQQYLKEANGWARELEAKKLRNIITHFDNMAEEEQALHNKLRWEGRSLDNWFNRMYNPKTDTSGVARTMIRNILNSKNGGSGIKSLASFFKK